MNWLKQMFGRKTDFELMLDHMRAAEERNAELTRLHMATIDRVIAARYDRPTLAQETSAPVSETRTDEDFSDVLTGDDDDAFFERLEKL